MEGNVLNRSELLPGHSASGKPDRLRSLKSVSGKFNKLIHHSRKHTVERYGPPVPSIVKDELSKRNAAETLKISNEGWAIFISGRRLLIWQSKEDNRLKVNHQCKELTLPRSDLPHRAELVAILIRPQSQVPACIASSPEGVIYFWPNIQEEFYVATYAKLQGQECHSLTEISPIGCILATTTATFFHVLVQHELMRGIYHVTCKQLKVPVPQGWLGGISRLIPSTIFGSSPSSDIVETRLIKIAAVNLRCETCEWTLFTLAEHKLQKWVLAPAEIERLTFECDIKPFAVEGFQKTIWRHCDSIPKEFKIWLLDMQPTDSGVMILVGATTPQDSPLFHYGFGILLAEKMQNRFYKFCPWRNTEFIYREADKPDLLSYRFLLWGKTALLYKSKSVLAVPVSHFEEDSDNIDFLKPNDRIIGAGMCGGVPVFFSKNHGIVSIVSRDQTRQYSTIPDFELEEMAFNKDSVSQLKAAFLYFKKKNLDMAKKIVNDLFPYEKEPKMDVDAALDKVVIKVRLDLINDIPEEDPRWAALRGIEISSGDSDSLQISDQLENKMEALESYFLFLQVTELWNRLAAVTLRDVVTPTTVVLSEHEEKIVAAISLKNQQGNHENLVEYCIKYVVDNQSLQHGLTHQDVFYREVSKITEGLQAITHWSKNLADSNKLPEEIALKLRGANRVLITVILEVNEWRKQKAEFFAPKGHFVPQSSKYLPWTAAPGSEGLKESIIKQHSLTIKYGSELSGDTKLKDCLYKQMLNFSDIILDGLRIYMESLKGKPKFEAIERFSGKILCYDV